MAERERQRKAANIGVGVGIGVGVEKRIGMAFGHEKAKALLDRIVAMNPGQRGYAVHEEPEEYRTNQIDPDTDPDPERQP